LYYAHSKQETVQMTTEIAEKFKATQDKINRAKNDQQRERARKESNIYPLNLLYMDQEAEIVRTVLSSNPAKIVLDLCKEKMASASPN
jgi:hypothetical protein